MKKLHRGFTLIELVVVIVLLGILSAVAIPKYIDYKSSASLAAAKGVAGALTAASEMNYAASLVGSTYTAVADCLSAGSLLNGGLPGIYTVPTLVTSASTVSPALTCNLKNTETSQNSNFFFFTAP